MTSENSHTRTDGRLRQIHWSYSALLQLTERSRELSSKYGIKSAAIDPWRILWAWA